jgi:hypothetical protein
MKRFLSKAGPTSILLMLAMCTGIKESDSINSDPPFTETPYPRIAMLWRTVRGQEGLESAAKHDLIMAGQGFLGLIPNREPAGLADAYTEESLKTARERIGRIREVNPDALVIADMLFYEYLDEMLPEDHPWWLRKDGERVQFWPGTHRMDWYPEYDIKIGLPVEDGKRINPYVWTRKYEKALVVLNLPGTEEDYIIETGQKAVDAFSGDEGFQFIIPPGDGRILVLR